MTLINELPEDGASEFYESIFAEWEEIHSEIFNLLEERLEHFGLASDFGRYFEPEEVQTFADDITDLIAYFDARAEDAQVEVYGTTVEVGLDSPSDWLQSQVDAAEWLATEEATPQGSAHWEGYRQAMLDVQTNFSGRGVLGA